MINQLSTIDQLFLKIQKLDIEIDEKLQSVENIREFAQIVELLKTKVHYVKMIDRDVKRRKQLEEGETNESND